MLTVESLTSELGLKVLAGGDGAPEQEIRWVHITELLDPTPWLSGGELLLTTGIPLENAEKQRAFIRRLADAGVAGLGFGTGFDHAKVPKAVLTEAKAAGFPVFEVPYETPFIAITEAAFSRLVNEQYDVLSRGIAVNERLERLVLQGGGLDEVAREIAAAIGGSSVVLDARGEVLASGGRRLPEYLLD
ncbi:MAG: PucR family transcriptional regulator ligand-binding domain-containing protein, partial [Solirubrobacterales bacterium]